MEDQRRSEAQGTTLTVIFARRQDARREEDGPATLAGEVTEVRDGGDRLAAGAGKGAAAAARAVRLHATSAGRAAAHQRRDSLIIPSRLWRNPHLSSVLHR
jgi:hypothetical protein